MKVRRATKCARCGRVVPTTGFMVRYKGGLWHPACARAHITGRQEAKVLAAR